MATFQPAPTWAPVTVTDSLTGEDSFNPVWLKWFIDIASFITANGGGGAIDLTTVNGIVARIAASTYAARTIQGTAGNISVTNGDGVAGDPTISCLRGVKNAIINGNFDIWQRATIQTSTGYGSDDRWWNGNNGSTKIHSRQEFILGQTAVPYEPTYYSRTIVTSVAGAANHAGIHQKIESVRTFAGQTATLSFYAKADVNKNIAVDFAQGFGTGGTPSAIVTGIGVTTFPLTTSWQKFTTTVAIPSISGKVLGTNNDSWLIVQFWFDAGSDYNSRTNSLGQQSGTFDIAQVQFELGGVATLFEQRSIGEELALCQRYFQKIFSPLTVGVAATSTVANRNGISLIRQMRVAPTVNIVGTLDVYDGTMAGTVTTLSLTHTTVASISYDATIATGSLTVGRVLLGIDFGSGGALTADAEL